MNDDPTLRDASKAAREAAKKVSEKALNTRIPLTRIKSVSKFFIKNWIAVVVSISTGLALVAYYANETSTANCQYIALSEDLNNMDKISEGKAAIILYPPYKKYLSLSTRSNPGAADPKFDLLKWLKNEKKDYMLLDDPTFFSGANNAKVTERIVDLYLKYAAARCAAQPGSSVLLISALQTIFVFLLIIFLFPRRPSTSL